MKLIFIKSPAGLPYKLGYKIGEEADIKEALALDLLDSGIAIKAEPVEKPAPKKRTSKKANG